MKRLTRIISGMFAVVALALVPTSGVFAQATSNVTQQINGGALSAAILDASRVVVASPSFSMSAAPFSFSCQTVSGTLGSTSARLYAINPSATTSGQGWNLSLAATGPWTSGSNTYAYNNAAGSGCTAGQLTVNPSAGTLVADCTTTACTSAVVTKGTSTAMTGTTPVTILTGAIGTSVYRGYIHSIPLSQAIPGEQPSGAYTLPVTLTMTAS